MSGNDNPQQANLITGRQWLACLAVIVTQGADLITTLIGMDMGLRELNPIAAYFLNMGNGAFFLFKAALSTVFIVVALGTPPNGGAGVWFVNALTALVAASNVNELAGVDAT